MSDESFLKRWSRRKQEGEKPPPAEAAPDAPPPQAAAPETPPADTPPPAEDEAIDPATLPPIDSLGAGSDYTVFLKKGVPEALRIAALRKAWVTDPFIRDFRGPAEYSWDFTTPEFNLRPSDDVAKMLGRIFGEGEQRDAAALPQPEVVTAPEAESTAAPAAPEPARISHRPDLAPAAESKEKSNESLARRRHGGAAPK